MLLPPTPNHSIASVTTNSSALYNKKPCVLAEVPPRHLPVCGRGGGPKRLVAWGQGGESVGVGVKMDFRVGVGMQEMRHECVLLLCERFHLEQCVR